MDALTVSKLIINRFSKLTGEQRIAKYKGLTAIVTNGYPKIRPVLNLDFISAQVLDPRVTFTRNSIGTFVNRKGYIETALAGVPRFDSAYTSSNYCKGLLVEDAATSLITVSNNLFLSEWVRYNVTVESIRGQAPDGSTTATLIKDTTSVTEHFVDFFTPVLTSGVDYVASVYIKSSNSNVATITIIAVGSTISNSNATFPIASGVVSAVSVNGHISSSGSIAVGDGWYRCYVIFNITGTSTDCRFRIYPGVGGAIAGSATGSYYWGANLCLGSYVTSYIPSVLTFTGRTSIGTYIGSTGLIETAANGAARYQYNLSDLSIPKVLLIEINSVNLINYSEQFTSWSLGDSTVVNNTTLAPSGLVTAGTFTQNTTFISANNITLAAGLPYTISLFIHYSSTASYLRFRVTNVAGSCSFHINVQTKQVTSANVGFTGGLFETMANGFYRVSFQYTPPTGDEGLRGFALHLVAGGTSGTSDVGKTLVCWGCQVEQRPYVTSYIPTAGSQVARSDDTYSKQTSCVREADNVSLQGSNFKSWFKKEEGTFVVSNYLSEATASLRSLTIGDGTSQNFIQVSAGSGSSLGSYLESFSNGINDGLPSAGNYANTKNMSQKVAFSYKDTSFSFANLNSQSPSSFTATVKAIDKVDRLILGHYGFSNRISSTYKYIRFYNKKLSDQELLALSIEN